MKIEKGSPDLESEVIFRDFCCHCGTCGALCPHIEYGTDGIPMVLDSCNEVVGLCYNSCPKTGFNVTLMEQKVFGKNREDELLGVYSDKVLVKSTNSKNILQNIIETAFKNNIIDAMVVPEHKSKKPANNIGVVITDPKEIPELPNMNTMYTGPLNPAVNVAFQNGKKSIGLIGNPCHIQGAMKVKYSDFKTRMEALKLKIGVMCASGGTDGCIYCIDYTAEFADISYGFLGLEKGTAALLIRTELGKKLYDLAIKDKMIKEISKEPNLEKITTQTSKKKKRNIKNLLKKDFGKVGYLELSSKELDSYFG